MCVLAVCSQLAVAAEVAHFFRETVAVDSQSRQDRQRAARAALATVLVRVSGSTDVLHDAAIRSALSRAERYLGQFSYQRNGEAILSDDELPFKLIMEFQPELVTDLLKQSGQPLWSANRPAILACIEVFDGASRRQVSQADADADEWLQHWNTLIGEQAHRRGLPIRLPAADNGACQGQSAAMKTDLMLEGELHLVGENCVAQWSMLFEERDHQWQFGTDSLEACVAKAADAVADTLSASYAFAALGGEQLPLLLQVANIGGFPAYTEVMLALQGLAMVESVNVASVTQDTVNFSLEIQGEVDTLEQAIRMQRLLQKDTAPPVVVEPEKVDPPMANSPQVTPVPGAAVESPELSRTGLLPPASAAVISEEPARVRLYYRLPAR
jgi:hypothetical protein